MKWYVKNQTIGRLCRAAGCCLAIGARNRELFLAYGVPEDRIKVAPYFVDNELFSSEAAKLTPQRDVLRTKFELPPDAVVFLFMGKLIEKKHPDHLLYAWLSLPESLKKKSALLFAGSGEMMDDLRSLSKGDTRIRFAGFLNRKQLPEAYAVSNVLVLPSDEGETWGLVVNEAMASKLPAVISDRVGCGPDLIVESETGHVFPFGNEEALRRRMEKLIISPEVIATMGSKASEHVKFASPEHAADGVIELLESMSEKKKKML